MDVEEKRKTWAGDTNDCGVSINFGISFNFRLWEIIFGVCASGLEVSDLLIISDNLN